MSGALRIAAAAIAVLTASGCAHEIGLRSSPTGLSRASRYVTFFLMSANSSGNADVDRQVNAGIEAALADKGLVKTSPEEAEAVVVVHTATADKRSRDALYQGWGGWAWRLPDTASTGTGDSYAAGSVVVDMFDAWTKKLVWHGVARHAVATGSNGSAHAFNRAVTAMFATFPAAGSGAARRAAANAEGDQSINIIFSPRPTLLVEIDGEPRYEDIAGTALERIANTNALIVRDETGMLYLRVGGRWMEADDVIGPWSLAGTVPDGADVALAEAANGGPADRFGSTSGQDGPPAVFVTTAPAALIVTEGDPEYAAVDGTSLLYVKNTSASVFKEPTDRELYVHLPSGWFRAWTTKGPWQRVSEADLPGDLRTRN